MPDDDQSLTKLRQDLREDITRLRADISAQTVVAAVGVSPDRLSALLDLLDEWEPKPPVILGLCDLYYVYEYAVEVRNPGGYQVARCPVCQHDFANTTRGLAMENLRQHLVTP